jgi:hypothetical protein
VAPERPGVSPPSPGSAEAHGVDPDSSRSLEAAVATAHVLLNADGDIDTSHRILVGAIEAAIPETPPALAVTEALNLLCLVCFFGGRPELWPPVDAAINRWPRTPPSVELLRRLLGDPAHAGPPAIAHLDAAIADLHHDPDPAEVIRISTASTYVDRLAGCRPALRRVVSTGRETGDVASTVKAAELLAFEAFFEAAGRSRRAACRVASALRARRLPAPRLVRQVRSGPPGGRSWRRRLRALPYR